MSAEQKNMAEQFLVSPLLWLAVFVLVTLAYVHAFFVDTSRASQTVLINFAYFTPIAIGMIVWPSIITLARGKWLGGIERVTLKGLAFFPVCVAAFFVLLLLRKFWLPMPEIKRIHPVWLSTWFVFSRVGISLLILWIIAFVYAGSLKKTNKTLGAYFIVVYCVALTFVAFDFIMALDPRWYSSLFGGYYFISGLYGAVTAWTLLCILHGFGREPAGGDKYTITPGTTKIQDLAGLIITFSILTSYMLFAQLIVLWYENLPHEVRYLIPRYNLPPWNRVSLLLIFTIYLGPLILLLTNWSRTNRIYLGSVCVLVLVCLWIERWWLITPTTTPENFPLGWIELVSAGSFLSLYILCCTLRQYLHSEADDGKA